MRHDPFRCNEGISQRSPQCLNVFLAPLSCLSRSSLSFWPRPLLVAIRAHAPSSTRDRHHRYSRQDPFFNAHRPANDEEILDATTGDKEFWIINGAHNLCYLHPAQQGIRSNLNLITSNGHVYSFLPNGDQQRTDCGARFETNLCRAQRGIHNCWKSGTRAARTGFRSRAIQDRRRQRPLEAARAVEAAEQRAQQEISQYRERYAGKNSRSTTPTTPKPPPPVSGLLTAIYHDDKFTYIKCAPRRSQLFYEVKDGKPNLINFDLANGVYVVRRSWTAAISPWQKESHIRTPRCRLLKSGNIHG